MAIPKWRYREHLLKLLCKWLDVKMNTRHLVCCITNKYANFSPTGELPKDRALVQIRTMKGDYLYVTGPINALQINHIVYAGPSRFSAYRCSD